MKKYAVSLSSLAQNKIELLLEYFDTKNAGKSKEIFLRRLLKKKNQIARYPESCIRSNIEKAVYKAVVDKNTSFFYRIQNEEIEIITLIDNRQDPKKNKP